MKTSELVRVGVLASCALVASLGAQEAVLPESQKQSQKQSEAKAVAAATSAPEVAPLVPFVLPVPSGWGTETIVFPLEFATDLPYEGLEELRFAPGMFEQKGDDFWSYVFVWWVQTDGPSDPHQLAVHLEAYFRGLAASVAESRWESVPPSARFSAAMETGDGSRFHGTAETFDAFVTMEQLVLHVKGEVVLCSAQDHKAVLFALSPQATDHPVWEELLAIVEGFDCS